MEVVETVSGAEKIEKSVGVIVQEVFLIESLCGIFFEAVEYTKANVTPFFGVESAGEDFYARDSLKKRINADAAFMLDIITRAGLAAASVPRLKSRHKCDFGRWAYHFESCHHVVSEIVNLTRARLIKIEQCVRFCKQAADDDLSKEIYDLSVLLTEASGSMQGVENTSAVLKPFLQLPKLVTGKKKITDFIEEIFGDVVKTKSKIMSGMVCTVYNNFKPELATSPPVDKESFLFDARKDLLLVKEGGEEILRKFTTLKNETSQTKNGK